MAKVSAWEVVDNMLQMCVAREHHLWSNHSDLTDGQDIYEIQLLGKAATCATCLLTFMTSSTNFYHGVTKLFKVLKARKRMSLLPLDSSITQEVERLLQVEMCSSLTYLMAPAWGTRNALALFNPMWPRASVLGLYFFNMQVW